MSPDWGHDLRRRAPPALQRAQGPDSQRNGVPGFGSDAVPDGALPDIPRCETGTRGLLGAAGGSALGRAREEHERNPAPRVAALRFASRTR